MEKSKARNADIFFQLTKRHLLVFFKNKIRVFYTLLVPVIIFVVYLLFLRDLEIGGIKSALVQMGLEKPEWKSMTDALMQDAVFWKQVETLVDSWMICGIMGLSAITVSLQTNTVIVEDKQNGVNRDFASSPIHKSLIVGSYFFYNFIVTALICALFLVICLIYLAAVGEFVITFANFLTVLSVLFYSTVSATLLTVFICSAVKTEGTMASIVAIFSTAIGFLIGAYMPLGMLPTWVQGICGFIPGTYSCSLLRYGFMATPIESLTQYVTQTLGFEHAAEMLGTITNSFGYNLNFFGVTVTPQYQAVALAVFIVVFVFLNVGFGNKLAAVLGMGKKKKKKK